jgi:RNA polymerase sigma factor (sigma-70 family)
LQQTGFRTTFEVMAVTETGHLASREVDDLYRRHGGEVYRYAYAVLGNHADAEDITQTTFLNAYRSLEQGVKPRKPANWLLTIASNAIKQRFRQEQARPRLVELDERLAGHETDEDDGPSVGELLTALSKIPPQQRQALVLREFEGRSYAEIAGILSVTTSALETLLFRARRSLAEELQHQLSCTEAQLAISKSADDRLGRKERRRLKDHLAECPDCAHFARLQQRHSRALRGLMLIPIPISLSIFKSLEGAGTASAATLPVAAGTGAVATGVGVGAGAGAGATGGGLFAGGVAIKAVAAVAAVTVAGGAAVGGVAEVTKNDKPKQKTPPAATSPGQRLGQTAPRGVLVPGNGVARGKTSAPGQVKRTAGTSAHKKQTIKHVSTKPKKPKGTHPAKPATAATGKHVAGANRQNTPKSTAPTTHSSGKSQSSDSGEKQPDVTTSQPQTSSGQGGGRGGNGNGSGASNGSTGSTTQSTESKPGNDKSGKS